MSLDLTSVLAKIGRAHEHSQTLRNELKAWRDSKPILVTQRVNADSTRYSLIAHIGIEPPLQRWTLMIGDVVHNLRTALDHLVYSIAISQSGVNPPPNEGQLAFPVCDTEDNFRQERTRRLGCLNLPVQTAIERSQPYNRGNPHLPPLLSILRNFENTDKHKLLRLAFAAVAKANIGFEGPKPAAGVEMNFVPHHGEIKNGTEIAAYTFSSPTPKMKFKHSELLIVVAVWHGKHDPSGPEGSDQTDFPSLLSRLFEEVRYVVELVADAAR